MSGNWSIRFDRPVVFTHHAQQRMAQRGVDEKLALDVVETGQTKWKDETRL